VTLEIVGSGRYWVDTNWRFQFLNPIVYMNYYIYMDKDTGKDNDLAVDMNLGMDMDNTDT
jgi:hypothetical protein